MKISNAVYKYPAVYFIVNKCFSFLILLTFFSFLYGCKKSENSLKPPPAWPKNPNIILIVGDDIGYEIPTCDGGQSYSTPSIDALAQRGVRFTECHASPLCSPARFMLLTGKYNFRNYTTWGVLDLHEKTIGNMMHEAGYATCYAGKWQLDGGDASIHNFGFDKYCVNEAFKDDTSENESSHYKNPVIYENSKFLPDSAVLNKYSADIFKNYVLNFIDSNANRPFFIYYATDLAHRPFSPTPDDPEFADWDPDSHVSDAAFFPSMIRYMDKSIGIVINKLQQLHLDNNTIILFTGDNGTPGDPNGIVSYFNGYQIAGGKGTTKEYGTHVPLIVSGPMVANAGTANNNLIDFTDVLPTLAEVAGKPVPINYGTLDGTSFYSQLNGSPTNSKDWIYNYYNPHPDLDPLKTQIWVQNKTYKLYADGRFYNIENDILERNPLQNSQLSGYEQQVKEEFNIVISQIHTMIRF